MQLLIVYIILALTLAYAVYALVKHMRKKNDACGDCSGCDLKNEIKKNLKNKTTKNPNTCGCNPENK